MKENKTLFVPASRKIYRPKALGTSGGFTSWIVVVCMSLSITLFSAIAWNSYDALRDVKMEKLYVQNMYGAEKGLVWGLEKLAKYHQTSGILYIAFLMRMGILLPLKHNVLIQMNMIL